MQTESPNSTESIIQHSDVDSVYEGKVRAVIAQYDINIAKISSKARFSIYAEILFVILPFVTAMIIFTYKGQSKNLAFMSEWSLAAAVLFGQAIVKNLYGLLSSRKKVRAERVAFATALLIVFGLAPSLIVHSLVLVKTPDTSNWLAAAQLTLFMLSLLSFYVYGGRGQTLSESISYDSK